MKLRKGDVFRAGRPNGGFAGWYYAYRIHSIAGSRVHLIGCLGPYPASDLIMDRVDLETGIRKGEWLPWDGPGGVL